MNLKLLSLAVASLLSIPLLPSARAAVAVTLAPAATNNNFAGNLNFTVTGITNSQTVVIGRYFDLNTNGVIDATDPLIQSFSIRDGLLQQIGGATNYNRPRDLDGTTNSSISTALSLLDTNNTDHIVGKYIFRVRDTNGATLVTTNFTITNFPYSQMVTGLVQSGVTNLGNALVAALQQSASGNQRFVAGVAGSVAGAYSLKLPVGTYQLIGVRSNHVADFSAAPTVTLTSGQTKGTNVSMIPATRTISGRVVDGGNTNLGVAGVQLFFQSTNDLFTLTWTDTNGNFSVGVTASTWGIDLYEGAAALAGLLRNQGSSQPTADTTAGNVSGVLLVAPRVTSLFYGLVKDNLGAPVRGIGLYASDGMNFSSTGFSDTNGAYAAGATSSNWFINLSNGGELGDSGYVGTSGSNYTFAGGDAVRVDFIVRAASNTISGTLKDTNNVPATDVNVYAWATIGGQQYQANANTDSGGNYTLHVADGTWTVGVDCYSINFLDYDCPTNVIVTLGPPTNRTVYFTLLPIQPLLVATTSLPDALVGNFYAQNLNASGGVYPYNWSVISNAPPSGIFIDSFGNIQGTPGSAGLVNFTVQVNDGRGSNATLGLSINVLPNNPVITTVSNLPNGVANCSYVFALSATGGTSPYHWTLESGSLPGGLSFNTNGVFVGSPNAGGTFNFSARVTDFFGGFAVRAFNLNVNAALSVSTLTLPAAVAGSNYNTSLTASGGQGSYAWTIVGGGLPASLTLNTNGTISGTPLTAGVSNVTVRVTDSCAFADKLLTLSVLGRATLTNVAGIVSNNQFQFFLNGAAGLNYVVQFNGDLGTTNWSNLFTTNAPSNLFRVVVPNATNSHGFYRAIATP